MKILILGASGMLGNVLFNNLSKIQNFKIYGSIRNDKSVSFFPKNLRQNLINNIDAINFEELHDFIIDLSPELIINCVGMIKQKSKNYDLKQMYLINSKLPLYLGKLCKKISVKLIHISTDCVFSGDIGNYNERSQTDAIDEYGKSKLAGEISNNQNVITLRTSIVGHELIGDYSLIDWFLKQENEIEGYTKAIFSGLTTIELCNIINNYILKLPSLTGLYHVGGFPIDKFSLLSIVSKIYNKNINILPSDKVKINRSLDSSLFMNKTGYVRVKWEEMIKNLYLSNYSSKYIKKQ